MGKPDAVIYKEALRQLDLPLNEVIAIGDSLEHDIKGRSTSRPIDKPCFLSSTWIRGCR